MNEGENKLMNYLKNMENEELLKFISEVSEENREFWSRGEGIDVGNFVDELERCMINEILEANK